MKFYFSQFTKKNRLTITLFTFGTAIATFFVLNILFPLNIHINYSQEITASDGTVLHAFLSADDKWRLNTELNEITPSLKKALIFKEDKYFYYHPGINPIAIIRALIENLISGKKQSGASTITMQVTRMLEPKERTYTNKFIEIFRAFQLELYYSKNEILQLYVNLIPYGSNIEGVKSAAVIFFQHTPDYLSLAQTIILTIIPNRPSSLVLGTDNDKIITERNKFLMKLEASNIFPKQDIEDALLEPLDAKRHPVPHFAPHISRRLVSSYPAQSTIHSCIDRMKQEKVENLAFNYIRRIHHMNITNCAALVINNHNHSVEAYVGSSDFFNQADNGQVDGVRAIRSPGSTLKPYLYSLAFEKGLITPKATITDVPVNFNGYMPRNFDEQFHGTVTAEFALANSLNVPAVKLLNEFGVSSFIHDLEKAGFRNFLNHEDQFGLSAILGGCGVTLEELTTLYSCFASEGLLLKPQWVKEHILSDTVRILTPGAVYMITEILTRHMRPDLPNNYESSTHLPRIAWKTGTSYGRRDAWSIGYNMDYTIGVWVGNFNGTGVPELTGADLATPLLFDIFNGIDYNAKNDWWVMPPGVDFRLVCSETGLVPNDFCINQVMDYYIQGISSMKTCNHLKEVFVSPDERISYCRNCLPQAGYKTKFFADLPATLVSFYESENIPYGRIPPHNPDCNHLLIDNPPVITSPSDGTEYVLEKNENQQLMLSCNADNEVQKVYWYINNQFYKSAAAGDKIFFTPESGSVKVSCTDDKGRNSDVNIRISLLQ
ncbi:MAG: penicillin-binding protein 1C [Chitinophagales bacterium]|nr:penicillin-binding protein 1C [Chitinophagales bacterium]